LAILMALAQATGLAFAREQSSSGVQDDPARSFVIPNSERRALVALYKATHGEGWTHHDRWLGPRGTECSWYGIACIHRREKLGNVGFVRLDGNNLVGTIPTELGLLTKLEWLELRENHLTGEIPVTLARLNNLKLMDVHGNQFSGMVPRELIGNRLMAIWISTLRRIFSPISQRSISNQVLRLCCAQARGTYSATMVAPSLTVCGVVMPPRMIGPHTAKCGREESSTGNLQRWAGL